MYGLPSSLSNLFQMYINILPTVQQIAMYFLLAGGVAFFLVAVIKLLISSAKNKSSAYTMGFNGSNATGDQKDVKSVKSPLFNSRDVISDIIDEGKQVFFGKKKSQKPKNNAVYKETTRRKSSIANMIALVKRDPKSKKSKNKSKGDDGKQLMRDLTEVTLLRSSTDSETDSSEVKGKDPFYGEDNKNFVEAEENFTKLLKKRKEEEETDNDTDSKDDLENFEVDITMLDGLKEEIV